MIDLYFLNKATTVNRKVIMDRVVNTDTEFMPNGVKFSNKPVSAVIVKLSAIERANLSIMSSESFAGNIASMRQ